MITNKTIENKNTTIFTATEQIVVTSMFFVNTGDEADNLTLMVNKSGQPISNAGYLILDMPILPKETFIFNTEKLVLDKAEMLIAKCNTGKMKVVTSSMVMT